MWDGFFIACLVAAITLYVPGTVIARACSLPTLFSFSIAPLVSCFLYATFGIVLKFANVKVTGTDMVGGAIFVAVAVLLVSLLVGNLEKARKEKPAKAHYRKPHIRKHQRKPDTKTKFIDSIDLHKILILALYILVAIVLANYIYLDSIGSSDTFSREFDTHYHFNAVRGFMESGSFSILDVSTHPELRNTGGYYPALWHIITAMIADMSGLEVTVCGNAVIYIALVLIFPVGIYSLLEQLFPKKPFAVVSGCVLSLAFAGFPWGMLVFGQLVSNFLSFCMLPGFLALFCLLISPESSIKSRVACAVFMTLSVITLIAAQPDALFTAALFCFAFGLSSLYAHFNRDIRSNKVNFRHAKQRTSDSDFTKKRNWTIIITATAVLLWVFFFNAPFMQPVIYCNPVIRFEFPGSIFNALTFAIGEKIMPQIPLGIVVLVGLVYSLMHKGFRWIFALWIMCTFIFIVDVSCEGMFKFIISGLWYNDIYRTGAILCIYSMIPAALCLGWAIEGLKTLFSKLDVEKMVNRVFCGISATAVLLLFSYFNYMAPINQMFEDEAVQDAIPGTKFYLNFSYNKDNEWVFDDSQRAFARKAMEVIKQDIPHADRVILDDKEIVINIPHDGSSWLYGLDGINTMCRAAWPPEGDPADNPIIREHLSELAISTDVQDAVYRLGAKYVLRLSPTPYDENPGRMTRYYNPEQWVGIESINDKTPGFEVLLAEGDMRLYKIVSPLD